MRMKAAALIIAIALVITAANLGSSLFFTHHTLMDMMFHNISLMCDFADDYVSTKIGLLVSDAEMVAGRLMKAGSGAEMEGIMRKQLDLFPDFMAFTVFNREGIEAAYGDSPAPINYLGDSKYIRYAFDGELVFSTTRISETTGKLVFYICMPMDENQVLCVTISGMLFSELFNGKKVFNTGQILMLDEEGVIIADYHSEVQADSGAHYHENLIFSRRHFYDVSSLENAQEGVNSENAGPSGVIVGNVCDEGEEYICVYRYVSATTLDWIIAAAIPLSESPAANMRNQLILVASVFLVLSVVAAVLVSGFIAKPYTKITEQNHRLKELNEITRAQMKKIQEVHRRPKLMMDATPICSMRCDRKGNKMMAEMLRLQAKLEGALKEAREASQAKSSFLASMSHEIRTPLNAVVGLSELVLDDDVLDNECKDKLEKIHVAGMTILGIVNDILDISKIESGKLAIYPIEYDTPSFINDTVTLNIISIEEKPIAFKLSVDEELPGKLYGDDLRVKQIFNNLLSNAFKYTNSGTVEWRISFERSGDDIWLVSSIQDSGIGIKPEDISKLFSDYNQLDGNTNRRVEGTGLGLAITKRLVEMMDGSITVESEYGKGTTFTVRLRQTFVSDTPIGKEVAKNLMDLHYTLSKCKQNAKFVRVDLSYARVLVVDDVPTNLDVVKGMMRPYRLNVDCASSGRQAIDMIRAENPRYNAVFMDQMMPGMDGVETMRIIREEIGTDYARNIPIIALTANAITGSEEMFLRKGFQAFISKPINMMKLDAILRQWLRDKNIEKNIDREGGFDPIAGHRCRAPGGGSPLFGVTINGLDIRRGLELFNDDESAFIDVLHSYAANTRSLINDLREHLAEENLKDYAIIIHGIKGSSYGIFAQEVGRAAEGLENKARAGELEAVRAGHVGFEKIAETLLDNIVMALEEIDAFTGKPIAAAPDPVLLTELREACKAFDMDRVDKAITPLESLRYERGQKTVDWLREQINNMNFEEIAGGEWPSE